MTFSRSASSGASSSRRASEVSSDTRTWDIEAYAPGVDWDAFFAGARVPDQKRMIVTDNTAIKSFAELFASTDLDTLKLWQELNVTAQATPYLPKSMVDSRFAFTSTLSGVSQQRPRWKRAVDLVNGLPSRGERTAIEYGARNCPG